MVWILKFSIKKSAGKVSLAAIPPTFAAAIIKIVGLFDLNQLSTERLSKRFNSSLEGVKSWFLELDDINTQSVYLLLESIEIISDFVSYGETQLFGQAKWSLYHLTSIVLEQDRIN